MRFFFLDKIDSMNTLKLKPTTNQTKKAFTIIEVVLVLAIAGLIFLMVFIALPALQRNQRDTQRKNDMSRFISAIQNYQSNNLGKVPLAADLGGNNGGSSVQNTNFGKSYLTINGDHFSDPNGRDYLLWEMPSTWGDSPGMNHTSSGGDRTPIYYFYNSVCRGDKVITKNGRNNFSIIMVLEGGGRYCLNN